MISNLKKLSYSTIIPLIIILTLFSAGILLPILSMVIFGAVLAYYVRYVAKKVKPYVKYDSLAVFLAMILLVIPFILLSYLVFSQLLSVAGSFLGSLITTDTSLNVTQMNKVVHGLGLPANISQSISGVLNSGISQLNSYLNGAAVSLVKSIPILAAQILVLIVSVFYFALDGHKVIQYVNDITPDKDKSFYQQLFQRADELFKSIIVGNVVPAIILTIISGIIYFLLGYPYVILLAVITGIAMFIPSFGWVAYGSIGIYSILTGNTLQGVLLISLSWISETTIEYYIRPRISVHYSQIHPLVFLLGFIFGAVTLGIPGLFIGPLILGITYAAYQIYREEKLKLDQAQNTV